MYVLFIWFVVLVAFLLLQVYTSLHCVVNIIGFGHFAVFLFFFWRAGTKHINVDTTHCRTLRKFSYGLLFFKLYNPDFFSFSKCYTFVPVNRGIFLITSFSVNFVLLLHHRHSWPDYLHSWPDYLHSWPDYFTSNSQREIWKKLSMFQFLKIVYWCHLMDAVLMRPLKLCMTFTVEFYVFIRFSNRDPFWNWRSQKFENFFFMVSNGINRAFGLCSVHV